jgi:predicted HTH domain antitoxin
MPIKFSSDPGSVDKYPPEEKVFWMLLYAPNKEGKFGTGIKGNMWLQKDMFLLTKNLNELKELKFDEHHFGPFSPVVQSIQVQHANSGLIRQPLEDNGPIKLTEKGMQTGKKIWESTSEIERRVVTKIKQFLNDMNTWEMIAFVYSTYPETTKNSDVVPEFEKNRLDSAVRLFQRNMVSLERAARISGQTMDEFVHALKQRKVQTSNQDTEGFKEDLKFLEHLT